ncbi:MAG: solute:Na+ symporter, SSS family, partial [Halanaerobium sp. 4-GBenrich]
GSITALYLQFSSWSPLGHGAGVWTLLVSTAVFVIGSLFTEAPTEKADQFIDYINEECRQRNII